MILFVFTKNYLFPLNGILVIRNGACNNIGYFIARSTETHNRAACDSIKIIANCSEFHS